MSTRRDPEDCSPAGLARHLVAYARGVSVSSPLYGRLLLAVADDPDLLALAGAARRDQPAGLLLLGAVHYMLLKSAEPLPPLAGFFAGVAGGVARTGDPVSAFREFCLDRAHLVLIAGRGDPAPAGGYAQGRFTRWPRSRSSMCETRTHASGSAR